VIDASDVTACLVTRGDQPEMMARIMDSLIFDEVVVWDNSLRPDKKCAGRYWAALESGAEIVYFQDDDVIVPQETQRALVAAYEPGVVVANWGHGLTPDGYDDLPLVCGGAVLDGDLPKMAMARYLQHFPMDDGFYYEADFVVGVLYERFKHLHLPFEIEMPVAQHPSRLCNQPWQRDLKRKITDQARSVRDGVLA
jgi:hypothetical protein